MGYKAGVSEDDLPRKTLGDYLYFGGAWGVLLIVLFFVASLAAGWLLMGWLGAR